MQWLAAISVKRPVFATVLILVLSVVGLFAYFQLGIDRFPKIDFPAVVITTVLRGAAPDMLAYSLMDALVDSYFAVIEQLDDYAEDLEADILEGASREVPEKIHQFKRCVSRLRRNVYPLRELLGSLHREHAHFFGPEIQVYLRDVYDHTVHIVESLDDLRELATGLLDIHLTTVSNRVNLEVRTLTVVATVFMPASLLAGIFGMNFQVMPWLERPAGFYYATGLMLAIAVIMLVLFWRRR